MPARTETNVPGAAIVLPSDIADAVRSAADRIVAAGGVWALSAEMSVFETCWTARHPGQRMTEIEYTPQLRLTTAPRERWISLVYFDNRHGRRFVHPDAIARAVRWVLGEVEVDTDDPRSDVEVEASAQNAETD